MAALGAVGARERRESEADKPLLSGLQGPFEEPELSSPRTDASRLRKMAPLVKPAAALLVTGTSLWIQIANWSPGWRAASSVGIGVGAGCLVHSLVNDRYISRVQQVVLSTFVGLLPFYRIDTFWANIKAMRRVSPPIIGAMMGGTLALYGKQLIHRGFMIRSDSLPASESAGSMIRSESLPASDLSRRKFEGVFWNDKWQYAKVATATACLAAYIWARNAVAVDPIYRDMADWGFMYYLTDFAAQKACDYVERRIQRAATAGLNGLTQLNESWWRIGKTAVNTVGFVAIPVIWAVVHNVPIWTVGAVTGFFDGFAFRSQERRFQNIPIDQLDELKLRTPVESPCFRFWRYASPIMDSLFVTGFMIYEWAFDPDIKRDDRITLVFFYALGMIPTAALNLWTECTWSVEKRASREAGRAFSKEWWQDVAIISQNNPRALGMHPRYFYFLMTSLMSMDSGQTLTEGRKWLNRAAWGCYGYAMLQEAWQTGCERVGTVFQFATMGLMNTVWPVIAMSEGKI